MNPERIWILIARQQSGEATAAELEELRGLLAADPDSGYSHEIVDKVWHAPLESLPENIPAVRIWDHIEAATASPNKKFAVPLRRRIFLAAASIVALVVGLGALYFWSPLRSGGGVPGPEKNLNQVSTQAGSRSKLELPDGTQVWLNGSSTITYAGNVFGKQKREVQLSGEAFFDVVKNEKAPFIIHTGAVNITVMGTAFNVKAYPKEKTVETALVRGLVEITTERDPDRKILLKPNEKIVIPVTPATSLKEKVHVADSARSELYSITKLAETGTTPEIAWMKPQLSFDNELFSSLAPKMEEWYHVKIHFKDPNIAGRRFSGVIEGESLAETLKAMQLSYPFHYEMKENELWIGDK